jgi:prepilin-type N-terminal cleavage/methylation domain-containing protein
MDLTSPRAFTLVEMMVSMAVLALLIAMIGQLLNSTLSVSIQGNKRMDGDEQARAVFDRMAVDFAQIVKRPDVDYFLKDSVTTQAATPAINDQLAFYSQVPGYNSASTASMEQSPVSLVAYRITSNSSSQYYNQLERFGYGLAWNGVSGTELPLIFSIASTTFSNNQVSPNPQNTISANWPNATWPYLGAAGTGVDPSYADEELVGPDVFRMEYYYILRGQTINGVTLPSQLSAIPWYTNVLAPFTNHSSVNGLQDVAAITVVIAVIDPKSRALVTNAQLVTLAGHMQDFSSSMKPGDLEDDWQSAISAAAGTSISLIAASSIRVYRRDFYLPQTYLIP